MRRLRGHGVAGRLGCAAHRRPASGAGPSTAARRAKKLSPFTAQLKTALRESLAALRSQAGLVLLLSTLLFSVRYSVQRADWWAELLGGIWPELANKELRLRIGSLIFYALIPMALVRFVHKKSLRRDFGLQLPDWRWFGFCVAYLAVMHPINWLYAQDPRLLSRVPFYAPARDGGLDFWAYQALVVGAMFGWEFILRGYMQFGLEQKLGAVAILVPLLPFALLHFSYPPVELFASILDGLFLGWLVYASRSLWPSVLVHVLQNLMWEIEVVYWFNRA